MSSRLAVQSPVVIVPSPSATVIERNAAELMAAELRARYGWQVHICDHERACEASLRVQLGVQGRDPLPLAEMASPTLSPEGLHIAIASQGAVTTVYVLGGGPRGVLYGVDEVLDRLQRSGDGTLDLTPVVQEPDNILRGATFVGHSDLFAPPGSAEAEAKVEHYKALLQHLARNRQNAVVLYAGWPSNLSPLLMWEEFPPLFDEGRRRMVEACRERMHRLIDTALAYGLDPYLCTTEFTFERGLLQACPDIAGTLPGNWATGLFSYLDKSDFAPLCPSQDRTWEWYGAKVRELFRTFPQLAGYELWVAESFSDVTTCQCPECAKRSPAERILLLVERTLEHMNAVAPGKTLLLRTFLSPRGSFEPEFFGPLQNRLPEQVIVSCKGQWGDMAYLNDPHPFVGSLNNGRESAEFDLMGEYRGGGSGAMISCIPEYIADRMRLYAERGCKRFWARHTEAYERFAGLQYINWEAYYRLSWDLGTPVETVWADWSRRTFGAAGPAMVDLLSQTDELVNKTLYARGVCINRHYWVFPDTLTGLRYFAVDNSARCMADGVSRIVPTPDNIAAVIAEKDEAVALVRTLQAALPPLRGQIDQLYFDTLQKVLRRSQLIVDIYRPMTEALWLYMQWEQTLSEFARDQQRQALLSALDRAERAIDEAERQDPFHERMALGSEAFGGTPVVDYARARQLVEEVRGNVTYTVAASKWQGITVRPYTAGWPIWRMYCLDADRTIRNLLG
ncbi:MAG: hypothetical protein ACUVX9_11730 [Anaerolineae bacterium]